jgi:peptide/nickel transport system permease protein
MLIVLRQVRRIVLTALIGGLLGATLVRLSPGFGVDERELDSRLSQESKDAIRLQHAGERNLAVFYVTYLSGIVRGDFGFSKTLNRPVWDLLKERLPLTLTSLAYGVAGGVLGGLALALLTLALRSRILDAASSVLSGLCLSVPAAVIALLFFWMGAPGRWAIALAVFPHIYRYAKNLLVESSQRPHVIAAQARGVSRTRILFAHIVAPVLPQIAALGGISVSLAFGAAIPIEVICDTPGIGQLAWQAALARDLPLLVTITVLVAVLTVTVNSLAETAIVSGRHSAAREARPA